MCGFAGWVDWTRPVGDELETVRQMAETLCSRGPDASGSWADRHVALAHRRLAVIDPSGGKQPMIAQGPGRTPVALCFNGEIYNFVSLRRRLQGLGHRFRTRSDTEVLLRAYLEWGTRMTTELDGIYAVALWDGSNRRLVLIRDPLGVKPLFHARVGNGMVFASEPKALLAHPAVPSRVDYDGVSELLGMAPVLTPGHAAFAGLRALPPGSTLTVDAGGGFETRHWQLEATPHTDDARATVRRVRELVEPAVHDQLFADVPVGTLLSGGLDSSVVTALAAGHRRGRGLRSFTLRPEGEAPPDLAEARRTARHLGVDLIEVDVPTDTLADAQLDAIRARDLPGLGELDTSLLGLLRGARTSVTAALSGEGADEIFCGYSWFLDSTPPTSRRFPWAYEIPEDFDVRSIELRDHVEHYVEARHREALARVPRLPGEDDLQRHHRTLQYLTLTHFLPALLDRKDRISMAVGMEVRVPFCSPELVQYAWNIPRHIQLAGGSPKTVLRAAARGLLPDRVIRRPKAHFPRTRDPRWAVAVHRQLQAVVDAPGSLVSAVIDVPRLRRILDSTADRPEYARPLAFVVRLDHWQRLNGVSLE